MQVINHIRTASVNKSNSFKVQPSYCCCKTVCMCMWSGPSASHRVYRHFQKKGRIVSWHTVSHPHPTVCLETVIDGCKTLIIILHHLIRSLFLNISSFSMRSPTLIYAHPESVHAVWHSQMQLLVQPSIWFHDPAQNPMNHKPPTALLISTA